MHSRLAFAVMLALAAMHAFAAMRAKTNPLPVPLAPARAKCLEQFGDWFKGWLPSAKKLASHA